MIESQTALLYHGKFQQLVYEMYKRDVNFMRFCSYLQDIETELQERGVFAVSLSDKERTILCVNELLAHAERLSSRVRVTIAMDSGPFAISTCTYDLLEDTAAAGVWFANSVVPGFLKEVALHAPGVSTDRGIIKDRNMF